MELYQEGCSLAETAPASFGADDAGAKPRAPTVVPFPSPAPFVPERSAYQPSQRGKGPAALGSLLIVAGVLSAFLAINTTIVPHKTTRLMAFALPVTPPPPPPQPVKQHAAPQPSQQQIFAPPPLVSVPAPATVVTTPEPPPAVPVLAPPAPAPEKPGPAAPPAIAHAGDLSSKMIFAKPPAYPLESRRRHEEGTVVLDLVLSLEGRVAEISVARSSGSDRLDKAALEAVRKWRWAPTTRDGQPVLVQGQVSIPFVLKR